MQDECDDNKHGCEQQCLNFPGGYKCTCHSGYRINTKDFKRCDGNVFIYKYAFQRILNNSKLAIFR